MAQAHEQQGRVDGQQERIDRVAQGDFRMRIEHLSGFVEGVVPLGWPHRWVKGMFTPLIRHRGRRIAPKPTMKGQDETKVTRFDQGKFNSDMKFNPNSATGLRPKKVD